MRAAHTMAVCPTLHLRPSETITIRAVHIAITGLTVAALLTGCTSRADNGAPSSSAARTAPASSGSASTSPTPTAPSDEPSVDMLPTFPDASTRPNLPNVAGVADIRGFITAVFDDTQLQWRRAFERAGTSYTPARLTLFDSNVRTGCGTQSSQVGPFYCPADRGVYLDVSFFDEMERRYGVQGDFSVAFVVAHELGHHIQLITGTSAQVAQATQANPSQANALSIRSELQADCYAGVWAHSTYRRGLLEPGDLDEALVAAAAVGDDFQQRSAGGTIQPEVWTHGSSAQRQQWLRTGYQSGSPAQCNTFAA